MNSQWQARLSEFGAKLSTQPPIHVCHFGDPDKERQAALGAACVTDLSCKSLVRISGEDASTFLQGQLTNDVENLSHDRLQLSAWCSAKGRVLVVIELFLIDDAIHMLLPSSLLETTLARLRMFVLRAKVQFTPSVDTIVLGIHGRDLAKHLVALDADDAHIFLHADDHGIVITSAESAADVWTRACEVASPVGTGAWRLSNVRRAIPSIDEHTADRYLPQMLNLELVDGVSFTKGCYVGQEIVARTQHLGRLKRRLYRLRSEHGDAKKHVVGDQISKREGGEKVGELLQVEAHPEGGFEALAVLDITSADNNALMSATDNSDLNIAALPYPLPG